MLPSFSCMPFTALEFQVVLTFRGPCFSKLESSHSGSYNPQPCKAILDIRAGGKHLQASSAKRDLEIRQNRAGIVAKGGPRLTVTGALTGNVPDASLRNRMEVFRDPCLLCKPKGRAPCAKLLKWVRVNAVQKSDLRFGARKLA